MKDFVIQKLIIYITFKIITINNIQINCNTFFKRIINNGNTSEEYEY